MTTAPAWVSFVGAAPAGSAMIPMPPAITSDAVNATARILEVDMFLLHPDGKVRPAPAPPARTPVGVVTLFVIAPS